MKLLLTSGGISNKTIENELKRLLNKDDFKGVKLLFCTTASNYEGFDMSDWLIEDLMYFKNAGFQIDVCDINGIPKEKFLPRFEWADAFFFEGGNTQWLREVVRNSGLETELQRLLEEKVWIGASAGSCVMCLKTFNSVQDLFDEEMKFLPKDGLGLIDFQVIPHLNNDGFPKINIENIKNVSKNLQKIDGKKLYILDDNSAVVVNENDIKIASEGIWFEI